MLVRPKNQAEREQERSELIPALEFHAAHEIEAAARRLKERGLRHPRPADLKLEVMLSADPSNRALIEMLDKVIDNRGPPSPR